MVVLCRLALVLVPMAALLATAASAQGDAELAAVARPRFETPLGEAGSGTAFFLRTHGTPGAVAVAAAHSFDFAELASTDRVEFRLGRSGRRVALSSRFYASPGRPFSEAGATLREDFVLFALDTPPYGVRILEAAPKPARKGTRVRILGVPAQIPQDEDDIHGKIVKADLDGIEVDLDVPADLRGWGGAPVLDAESGLVVGLLEAAWPDDDRLRLGVAPIAGVVDASRQPLADADGAFSRFARHAPGGTARARASAPEPRAPRPPALSPAGRRPDPGESLLGKAGAVDAKLVVEIEHPTPDAVVGDPTGAFIAGRALALLGQFRRFDVVLVLDTSASANQMSGADINGNGIVGQGGFRGMFGKSDPGDSVLAAEVAAAHQLLRGLDPRNTRVGLVTFAGEPPRGGGLFIGRQRQAAITEEALTTEYERIEKALDQILDRGANGMTHMAAGVDQATVELLGLRGSFSDSDPESDKVVLFLTDGQPTLPYDPIFEADNVRAVLRAADRAARAGIRIHSFALGPEALDGPIATVEMASRTDGYFTPVRHPGDIVEVIENVSFANIDDLKIRNLTTGSEASELIVNPDGSWSALVPLEAGRNTLEVIARSADGSTARASIAVQYAPGAPAPIMRRELVARRNRLLEQRLLELKRDRIAAEREAVEQTRQELTLEIERERDAARRRAEAQRKELDLEAERPPEAN